MSPPASEVDSQTGWPYEVGARFATIDEIADAAKAALPVEVWNYLDGGAGTERTLRANRAAFARWQLLPRVLTGGDPPDLRTTFLGIPLALPVLTAPFGSDGLFHPEGHLAVVRACAAAGVAAVVPEASTFSLEAVAEAAPAAARVFQLYPLGPVDNFRRMVRRAEDAGYGALCVTADSPTAGIKERVLRDRFAPDPGVVSGNYPPGSAVALSDVFGQLHTVDRATWSWSQLAEALDATSLPFLVKGVLTAADARAAVEIGAAGVVVSNHGGRQLDGVPAALDALPEVVAEVGDELAVAVDGGFRRGLDVLMALCLGADAVLIGRGAAYGLAAAGQEGVSRVLELLTAELTTCMTLLGRARIADLDRSALRATA